MRPLKASLSQADHIFIFAHIQQKLLWKLNLTFPLANLRKYKHQKEIYEERRKIFKRACQKKKIGEIYATGNKTRKSEGGRIERQKRNLTGFHPPEAPLFSSEPNRRCSTNMGLFFFSSSYYHLHSVCFFCLFIHDASNWR